MRAVTARILLCLLLLVATPVLIAQQHGEVPAAAGEAPAAAHTEGGQHGGGGGTGEVSIWWKWINFAILVGGLGYLAGKYMPGYFESRNEEIRESLDAAAKIKQQADARAAEIEARLKNLEPEIAELKAKAKEEIAAEGERIRQETADAVARIQAHAENEISAQAKVAQSELRAFAAKLALEAAENKLRSQIDPQQDAALINGFLRGLN
jgi:F-type H+-transporting ATPase subunit b